MYSIRGVVTQKRGDTITVKMCDGVTIQWESKELRYGEMVQVSYDFTNDVVRNVWKDGEEHMEPVLPDGPEDSGADIDYDNFLDMEASSS